MREEHIRQRDGHYKWNEVRKTTEKKKGSWGGAGRGGRAQKQAPSHGFMDKNEPVKETKKGQASLWKWGRG